ncbi:ABC transporter permease, partial [bacterium]
MSIPLILALRYLRGRKLRTFLTTLAVIFGVMIIFGLNSLIPSMMQTFRQNMLATAGKVDLTITSDVGASFGLDKLEELRAVDGIAQATGSLQETVTLPSSLGGSDPLTAVTSLMVVGIDPTTWVGIHSYSLAEGRYLTAADGNAVVMPQNLADKLHLKLGDSLVIPSAGGEAAMEIVGILNALPTAGVEQVYVTLPAAQRILNHPGEVNVLEAMLAAGSDRAAVEGRVTAAMGTGYHLGPLEYGAELMSSLQLGETAMSVIGGLAIIMGGFVIFNTFRTVVNERRHDLGMLRAIGASRRTLMGVIVIESLVQGIIGTLLGLLAGVGIAYAMTAAINPTLIKFLHFKMTAPIFQLDNLITAVILGIGITLVSGWMPARAAMRVTPMEALRPQLGADIERAARMRGWVGVGIIAISALILVLGKTTLVLLGALLFTIGLILVAPLLIHPISRGFGAALSLVYPREGPIARGNIARNPGRSAVTAAAMMIGLALVISIYTLITSIFDGFLGYLDQSLGADYLLMPPSLVLGGGNLGASGDLAERISALPDVAEVTTLRQAAARVD